MNFLVFLGWMNLILFSMSAEPHIAQNAIKIEHFDKLPQQILPLLAPYRVILIGETHGTKEAPEFCLGLIKMLASKKNPVVLALEISEDEQPIFDEFMKTGNSKVFAESKLFTDHHLYGLSIEAMVQLLFSLRNVENVKVYCSLSNQPSKSTWPASQEERDSKWAEFILKKTCSKDRPRVIVLGGAFHMSLIPQIVGKTSIKTMAYYLLQSKDFSLSEILSIDIKSKEKSFWGCVVDSEGSDFNMTNIPTRFGEIKSSYPDDNYSTSVNWDSYFLMEPMQKRYNAVLYIRNICSSKPFNLII